MTVNSFDVVNAVLRNAIGFDKLCQAKYVLLKKGEKGEKGKKGNVKR